MSLPKVQFLNKATPPHILTLIVLASMSALVMNMFLPSLPGMAVYFDTEYRVVQLSVAINLAVAATLQIFIGPIADRYGRRPVILGGLGIFLLATLGCLMSTTIWVFLVFRAIQAFVATAMVLSRAIVRDIHAQDKAASMLGYVTMGMSISPMIAPAIGGVLDEAYGWHAIFWALFIFGALTIALVWHDLGETAPARDRSFREQFQQYPELLLSTRFWGYTLSGAFSSGAFFAYLGGGPFVGSEVFGLSPSQFGLYFAAPSLGYFWGNFITGRYAVRAGINRLVLLGTLAASAGLMINLGLTLAGLSHPVAFFSLMTTLGFGNGLVLPNATSGALSIRPHLAGTASGLNGTMMIGGGAILSALAGSLLAPGTGAAPLLWIMLGTSLLSVAAIVIVIRRDRALAAMMKR